MIGLTLGKNILINATSVMEFPASFPDFNGSFVILSEVPPYYLHSLHVQHLHPLVFMSVLLEELTTSCDYRFLYWFHFAFMLLRNLQISKQNLKKKETKYLK